MTSPTNVAQLTKRASRASRAAGKMAADQQPQPAQQTPEQPATTEPETLASLSAKLRDAIAAGDTQAAHNLLAKIETFTPAKPAKAAKPEGMTTTEVKRVLLQRLVDLAAEPESIAKLTEGMNDRERTDALAALAQRLSYGAGAAELKWPSEVLPPRTILSGERKKIAAAAEK
jgi:hypothetical protein